MIHKDRIRHYIATPPPNGKYVLYWMQQAQRIEYNHALCRSIEIANELNLPLVVCFILTPDFPEANLRHYVFMLEGVADVQKELQKLGITFVLSAGPMAKSVLAMAQNAAWVVTDIGYLRIQRQWRAQLAKELRCPYTEVETDVTVPVAAASTKEESAARTLRPKIMKKLDVYLDRLVMPEYRRREKPPKIRPSDLIDPVNLARQVAKIKDITPVTHFHGGHAEAKLRLKQFISGKLPSYDALSRDPTKNHLSDLSPYLHFGQISPVEIVNDIKTSHAPQAAKDAYIEQVVVRRELAVNFIFYNQGYDRYASAVPGWSQKTLKDHVRDRRPYIYSYDEFDQGKTHDPYWNAAQMEMVIFGKMHNYMRMYWGKKVIEWTKTPHEAFEIMLALNNRYELDGRDPNGFAGIAWCFGRHDRPWQERPIFGKVRYMNAAGLEKKFKIDEYVMRIEAQFQFPL
jgi:deoxyribodipyrimidine photo-lyase